MAKQVIWSSQAEQEFANILEYWTNKNRSTTFSNKLIDLFEEATELISIYPEIGQLTDIENVRHKLVRDYLIFYRIDSDAINILTVWNPRQNPNKLKL
ncbi:type II toxin-antitoxin system RelE/ParE family toxin [Fulvivirga sp. 29W222]|uniref:Type II toxin-antitoxin system RelE/ParE family toxin n=1 Tax=Fulvivirga marina TaxID=2494733 RepID=A0A937FZD3_9BACT|nr:type II toxin-antitoxin system RelE/ParE family toxin [Fulvivirga marina]MBL6447802.1 type II toxin-antitoxin system RelE/ParE family toxin [Fulvivirga marina]